ncbi:hypothetical protein L3X38_036846 [Prunus dulcis]|uniref:Uncharacterized protein n=1 Tax=Prunus dulcis TaxID=3755 RepID=A0AAD4YQ46_PRUDU|nr:hypothetical protein L3X38_036846 [Prunus dulcis]
MNGVATLMISKSFSQISNIVTMIILKHDYVHLDFPPVTVPPQSAHKPSSSGSSLASFSAKGKSKAELQEIARQLIIQASQMDDDDETSPISQSSSSQPHQPSSQKTSQKDSTPKLRWADYEDNQDPYDLNSD